MNKKVIDSIFCQISQIREGGLPVLFRKLLAIPLILLSIPVVILVRALRPLILIRFGSLLSSRIGHFAINTEMYLCYRDVARDTKHTCDIFYYGGPICNQQLNKMWKRTIHIFPATYWLDRANRLIPAGDKHVVPLLSKTRDPYALLEHTRAHLSFTPEEERWGEAALRELGMSDGARFVCFIARSPAYLEKVFPNDNWGYHNYRDTDLKNLIPAAEELVHRGYFTIRMGAIAEESVETTNSMIIDYARENRTEFLDIFLGAKCHFYLGDSCGFHAIPMIFRRPLAIVNMIPLKYAPTWGSNYLFIPKKLWLRHECRFLTFREIFDSAIARFYSSQEYEQLGIEVIENTPEEITDLAVEMDERLKGSWQTTEEDEELQRLFWALFKPDEFNQIFLSRIGAKFLRQNRQIFEIG